MIANERGMTLVEILIAVAIIVTGLVGVMTGMQVASSGVATGQQQTTATFLAEQRMEDIRAFALSTSGAQGWANVTAANFADEAYGSLANYSTYRRTTTITNPTVTTKVVVISVFWRPVGVSATANAERSVTVRTVLASRT